MVVVGGISLAFDFTVIRVLRELKRLRNHCNWSNSQITDNQNKSLEILRKYAYQHSRFYQEFHKGLENAPLQELPTLTKSIMMDHFDEFVTDRSLHLEEIKRHLAAESTGRFHGKYEVVATSGSTGNPGIFLFDKSEWATIVASFARAREWAGLKVNLARRSKMAVVSSINELNLSAKVGKAVNTPFIPTLRLDATDRMENIVDKLNAWNPEAVVAYASMAYFLAIEQREGRLDIHPRFIFTASEVLTSDMLKTIEDVWGRVVFNEYVSTETATIAAEDEGHHGMHVFEDLLIVENVDEKNKPVKAGAYGSKILVSVLFSRTQPLIRYEISDNVRFADEEIPCSLPFTRIVEVEGRQEDVLSLPGIVTAEIKVHPNVFHDLMLTVPSKGWQVVQEKDGLLVLLIEPREDLEEIKKRISDVLENQGVKVPKIEIRSVLAIPKDRSGKSPLVKKYRQ